MSILDKIKSHKMEEVAKLKAIGARSGFEEISRRLPPPRGFCKAIANKYIADEIALIAEIKRASPSKGLIRTDFDVRQIAKAYLDGGACCLSVVTDGTFFKGSGDYIAQAHSVSELPVLRKDFLIDPLQVIEARAMGADCVLLILAMLDDVRARDLEDVANDLGLDVLIEIHDDAELDRALTMRSSLIGINNRDLTTFTADLGVSMRLSQRIGPDHLIVSESGIDGLGDVERLHGCGIRSVLVGESLLKSADIETTTRLISSWKETEHEQVSIHR